MAFLWSLTPCLWWSPGIPSDAVNLRQFRRKPRQLKIIWKQALGFLDASFYLCMHPIFKSLKLFTQVNRTDLKCSIYYRRTVTDSTQSLLHVILVSSTSLLRSSGVINASISDHLPVYAVLNLKRIKAAPTPFQRVATRTIRTIYCWSCQ